MSFKMLNCFQHWSNNPDSEWNCASPAYAFIVLKIVIKLITLINESGLMC